MPSWLSQEGSLIVFEALCPSNFTLVSCQTTPFKLPPDVELLPHAIKIPGMRQRTKR